jgi:hypothetical protein
VNDKARKNRAYGIATGGVLAALLSLSIVVFLFRPPMLDERTLCPTDKPIAGHTVVIVDRTDKWNPAVGETLREFIADAQKNTQRYQKFSVVSLDSGMSTRPLFSVCNPGEPDFWTDLYRGRRYTQRDFDEKFIGAAQTLTAQVREPSEAGSSPVVEYIHRWLGRDDFNATIKNRRMVLVSDMRQNSDQYSIYKAAANADELVPLVQREFGPAGRDVVFDVYFVSHGHDYNVSEAQVRGVWDKAFKGIPATYEWRQID